MKCDELGLMIIIINLRSKIMSIRSLLTPILILQMEFSSNYFVHSFEIFVVFKEIVSLPLFLDCFYLALRNGFLLFRIRKSGQNI